MAATHVSSSASLLAECKKQCKQITEHIHELWKQRKVRVSEHPVVQSQTNKIYTHTMTNKRLLRGHYNKVTALAWGQAQDNAEMLLSASQDGRLLVWHTKFGIKTGVVPLNSPWVMACAFTPSGKLVASGGLDNLISVHNPDEANNQDPKVILDGHEGYIAAIKFFSDSMCLSASGDSTCRLWDINTGKLTTKFEEHQADVMSIDIIDQHTFVTGSVDYTSRIFDTRQKTPALIFRGHESDINTVSVFPNKTAFVSGSDDSSCKLWDIRSQTSLENYFSDRIAAPVTSVAFSSSGRYLFAGYDGEAGDVYVWDTLHAVPVAPILNAHPGRVSCLAVDIHGQALATGGFDSLLKVFA